MAKLVKVAMIPFCDICKTTAKYNTPLTPAAQQYFKTAWASLCGGCFDRYGLDTTVTEEYIRA